MSSTGHEVQDLKSLTAQALFNVAPHESHARLRRIELSEEIIKSFIEETQSVDVQSLHYVPFSRFCLADTLLKIAGPELKQVIDQLVRDRETGGFTISLNDLTTDDEAFVKFGTAIAHLLGPVNHDLMSNAFYARFVVKHTDESDSYLRQAYRLFTLHTDGTFVNEATDWLLMMKFSERHAVGGESRLLHLDDWQEKTQFLDSKFACYPFEYKSPGSKNVDYTVNRPLFFENEFGLCVSFIDQFVQPKTIEQGVFLNDFSKSLENSEGTKEVPLPVGELIVLNNYFWFHGRAPFKENVKLHRELMRQRGSFSKPIEKVS